MCIRDRISNARGVALDNSGNLYIADLNNMRVRKVTPSGVISTVAGNGTQGYSGDGGAATSAELNQPIGVALDTSGGLYIADSFNNRIRKVTAAGVISTVAGNGTFGYSGDGGPATSAELADSSGVAVDSSGTIYIADWQTERVRKVTPAGIISTAAGNGAGGTGGFGAYSGDGGAATSAELSEPVGVTVDSSGNLYIADLANNRIRKVTYQTAFVTSTTVAASPNPSTGGQAVTFTATVTGSGGTPTGTVTFYDSTTSLGIGTLNGSGVATFTISSLASGPHTITAVYTGDANFEMCIRDRCQRADPRHTQPGLHAGEHDLHRPSCREFDVHRYGEVCAAVSRTTQWSDHADGQQRQPAGQHSAVWDGRWAAGRGAAGYDFHHRGQWDRGFLGRRRSSDQRGDLPTPGTGSERGRRCVLRGHHEQPHPQGDRGDGRYLHCRGH